MRCKRAISFFSAKLDGDLSEEQDRSLQAHLDTCPRCRALLERVGDTVAALRTLPELQLSDRESSQLRGAWTSAWTSLSGKSQAAPRGLARTATALGAVMILGAAVAISFSVLHHPQEVSESTAPAETVAESEAGPETGTPYVARTGVTSGTVPDQRPLPQVVSSARTVAAADMAGYAADAAQKQTFYSAVWQHAAASAEGGTAPTYDTETLNKLQSQCTEDMVGAAESLGEDAAGLRSAISAAITKATNQVPLLPCWAEKVVFEGKPAWIISLSGPDEAAPIKTGDNTREVTEPPPGELVWGNETQGALPRYLFVVDAGDLSILFQ